MGHTASNPGKKEQRQTANPTTETE
jgi:hypothetical protein